MTVHVAVPGDDELDLECLVLDVNGTLSDRGEPIPTAVRLLGSLRERLELHVLSADTFGTAQTLAAELGAEYRRIVNGADKRDYVNALGAQRSVAVR